MSQHLRTATRRGLHPAVTWKVLERFGQPGDPIDGSKYVRDYCSICGDPIRVASVRVGNICSNHTLERPRREKPVRDTDMVLDRIVRAMEEMP